MARRSLASRQALPEADLRAGARGVRLRVIRSPREEPIQRGAGGRGPPSVEQRHAPGKIDHRQLGIEARGLIVVGESGVPLAVGAVSWPRRTYRSACDGACSIRRVIAAICSCRSPCAAACAGRTRSTKVTTPTSHDQAIRIPRRRSVRASSESVLRPRRCQRQSPEKPACVKRSAGALVLVPLSRLAPPTYRRLVRPKMIRRRHLPSASRPRREPSRRGRG